MNWKLLDIRIGRANRVQYFAGLLISIIVLQIASFINKNILNSDILQYTLEIFGFYILVLLISRRFRDINIPAKWGLLTFIILIVLSFLTNTVAIIGFFGILLFLLVKAGDAPNDPSNNYGPAPVGLNLLNTAQIGDNGEQPVQIQETPIKGQ